MNDIWWELYAINWGRKAYRKWCADVYDRIMKLKMGITLTLHMRWFSCFREGSKWWATALNAHPNRFVLNGVWNTSVQFWQWIHNLQWVHHCLTRVHSGYGLSQWEMTLHNNIGSHWLRKASPLWQSCVLSRDRKVTMWSIFLPTISHVSLWNPSGVSSWYPRCTLIWASIH